MLKYNSKYKTWTLRLNNSYLVLEEIPKENKFQMFPNPNKFFDFKTYGERDGLLKVDKFRVMWSF